MIFSTLINQYLAQDPEVAERLADYKNKTIKIEFLPFRKKIFIDIHNGIISLSAQSEKSPDITLCGTPLALLRAWQSNAPQMPENIEITGDVLLLQRLKNIFNAIDIDWTEKLAQITNDPFAYSISQLFLTFNKCRHEAQKTFGRNIKEYLQEEYRLLVSAPELKDFYTAVDDLRDDAARLQTKLERIS
jgi:ubiquinone biosynthesis protein UbiJ